MHLAAPDRADRLLPSSLPELSGGRTRQTRDCGTPSFRQLRGREGGGGGGGGEGDTVISAVSPSE